MKKTFSIIAAHNLMRLRVLVFGVSFCYWVYLFFTSQMVIAMDALSYETLAKLLNQQGWVGYLKDGPNREPFYPLMIAINMQLGEQLNVPSLTIQKICQIFILLINLLLAFAILERLKVSETVKLLTVLYIGFSPAIVNAGFSLFSEIVSLPFVLAIVLVTAISWEAIQKGLVQRSFLLGLLTGVLFLAGAAGRGVFQAVFYPFVLVFLGLLVFEVFKGQKRAALSAACFTLIFILIFQSGMFFYKSLNKKYSGQFEFTDRYARMLFGNAEKRSRKMTRTILLSHIASVPGYGICRKFFTEEECLYCDFITIDGIYGAYLPKLLRGIDDPEERQRETLVLARERIFGHFFQYSLLTGIEFMRNFFWETAQLGYVKYPDGLRKLFESEFFNGPLRLTISVLSLISFGFLGYYIYKNRKVIISPDNEGFGPTVMCFFILLFILSYGGACALFSILTRYSLPLGPLYVIGIAYFMEKFLANTAKAK